MFKDHKYSLISITHITSFFRFLLLSTSNVRMSECPKVHFVALRFNYFISDPIFKFFVALFTTFGMREDDMVIFSLWCFRKLILNIQFLKDGLHTVV